MDLISVFAGLLGLCPVPTLHPSPVCLFLAEEISYQSTVSFSLYPAPAHASDLSLTLRDSEFLSVLPHKQPPLIVPFVSSGDFACVDEGTSKRLMGNHVQ